jgi:DNA replication protein
MEALSANIRTRLTEAGFPSDYLAPVYRCSVCRDTGRVGEPVKEYCDCFRKAYQRLLQREIGLSDNDRECFDHFDLSLFSDETLPGEAYSQRTLMEMLRDDCRDWADRFPDNRCRDLLLTGQSGLGKTFLLRAMARRLIERDVNVLMISAYRMIETLRKSYFENDEGAAELLEVPVLMIDDLGSEPLMQNVTIEQLFNLINERQNRGLSTVISTNLDLAKFRERYTERIASRLTDSRRCMVMTLKGRDIRTGGSRG